jgi:glycerol-3-phosphate cytidylyltransferase
MVRAGGKPFIGFTVGVWDVFHQGHINLLEEARNHCSYLVVGVMADYWARVQKGHDRPHDSLALRIENVRPYADKTVVLDTLDMTPYLQIADVWIKGGEQKNMRPEFWPSAVYVSPTDGISSTQIIKGEK